MGYILVVFVMLSMGEPRQVAPLHFPTAEMCLKAKDNVPAFIRSANEDIEDPDMRAIGYLAECVPFKLLPAGPEV